MSEPGGPAGPSGDGGRSPRVEASAGAQGSAGASADAGVAPPDRPASGAGGCPFHAAQAPGEGAARGGSAAPLPELPLEPFGELSEPTRERLREIAREANTEYVESVLEQHNFCPFSREGRRSGAAVCEVLLPTDRSVAPLLAAMERAAGLDAEVFQLVLPFRRVAPEVWVDFGKALTDAGNRALGPRPTFAVAPLHPALPYRRSNASALIPLLRRAPDPTLQWVRLDALARIYEGRAGDAEYVDPSRIAEFLAKMEAHAGATRRPLYDRIADANEETVRGLGFERLEAILDDIHARAWARYRALLQLGPAD